MRHALAAGPKPAVFIALWVRLAGGKISCVTLIPGYDDRKLGRKEPRPISARHDWVLVTSFNERHEGSEIEPALEDGDRCLGLTREYALRFVKGRPAAHCPRRRPGECWRRCATWRLRWATKPSCA